MLKYEKANTTGEKDLIEHYLDPMEYVFWKGKGNKLAFIFNSSMFIAPFAIIWLLIDCSIIIPIVISGAFAQMAFFMVPFFAVHLMPVWIWIGGMIRGAKKWQNSAYAITDKQVIIKNNASGMTVQCYKYDKIVTVRLHRGFLDKILGVSDLQFYLIDGSHVDVLDIKNVETLYVQVKQRIEETPCVREMHTETTAGQSEGHVCKDYPENFNPYS